MVYSLWRGGHMVSINAGGPWPGVNTCSILRVKSYVAGDADGASVKRSPARGKIIRMALREDGLGHVAVVGSGIMGITTALILRSRWKDLKVDIISESGYSESTSHGAGGLWEPYQIEGTSDDEIYRWGAATYAHFDRLNRTGERAGVQFVTTHDLTESPSTKTPQKPAWADIVHNFTCYEPNTSLHNYGNLQLVQEFGTYIVDQTYYLPYLSQKLEMLGAGTYAHKLESFEDLVDAGYKAIFNCTGMGSRELVGDTDLIPVRGQVRRVAAPWVKHATFLDGKFYILPNIDTVVVGGTQQRGNPSTAVDAEDSAIIWEAALRMCPSLSHATPVSDWVGLRPLRSSGVRVERCSLSSSSSSRCAVLVHNYGHGGSGITLHWGCVEEAVAAAAPDIVGILEGKHAIA